MDDRCRLASPDRVAAFWVPGELWIRAEGTFPENCWEASIHKSFLGVWPPEFSIEECRTADICSDQLTPYEVASTFPMTNPPEKVVVHRSGGPIDVMVEVVPDMQRADAATGVSAMLSVDEALAAAIARLPRTGTPNVGRSFDVSFHYQDGGFVGPLLVARLEPKKS